MLRNEVSMGGFHNHSNNNLNHIVGDGMKCKHHPDYKAESGEPTGLVEVERDYPDHYLLMKCNPEYRIEDQQFPCPYCWQTYARHLCNLMNEEDIEAFHYMDRIKELEEAAEKAYELLARIQDEVPMDAVSYALAKALEKK